MNSKIIRHRLFGILVRDSVEREHGHVDPLITEQNLQLVECSALTQEMRRERMTKSIASEFSLERDLASDLSPI